MPFSYQQLRKMSDERLIERFDQTAMSTQIGLSFLRDELARRDSERQGSRIERLTRRMFWITVFVAILTAANVVAVAVTISYPP